MNAPAFSRISTGDPVIVTAMDEAWSFVDGWKGRVIGWHQGHAVVKCFNPDGQEITLYVPPEQLTVSIGPIH